MAKKVKKPTAIEREARIVKVYKLLLDSKSRPEIMEYCRKYMGLERAATDNLIKEATVRINQDMAAVAPTALASILHRQNKLYDAAEKADNLAVARQILMDQAKLRGIGSTNVNITVEDKDELAHLTDEELRAFYGSYKT